MIKNPVKIFLYTLILLFNIVFYSCEKKDVYYELPEMENKLVINCFFNPDSIWKANISKLDDLQSLSPDTNLWITDAQVLLFEGKKLIDTLKYLKNNEYISTKGLKPKFNKSYKIYVKCENYDNAYSDYQMLPSPIIIDSIALLDYLPSGIFPNELYILQENQQIDYYSITVKLKNAYHGQYFKIFASDNQLNNKEGVYLSKTSKQNFIEFYSWKCSILESLKTSNLSLELPFDPDYSEKLNIYTISESYALFELSYAEYDFVINTTYLLTPNNIYSNINGGLGIFAGYTSNTIDLLNNLE